MGLEIIEMIGVRRDEVEAQEARLDDLWPKHFATCGSGENLDIRRKVLVDEFLH